VVHEAVEVVEVFVAKKAIVDDVPLAAGVLERVAIALSREIKPLWQMSISIV
jgi:hypothetical protein